MGILDQIANSGRGIGAGLLAGQQNQYAINQNKQLAQERQGQEARNRFVQDRQFNAQQNRYRQQDQKQANEAQMAFGKETMEILSNLPPEQRQQAFMARSQQAAQTVGLPPNFDPAQSWAQIEPMLPPPDQKLITGVDPKTGAAVRVPDRPGEVVYQKPPAPPNPQHPAAIRKLEAQAEKAELDLAQARKDAEADKETQQEIVDLARSLLTTNENGEYVLAPGVSRVYGKVDALLPSIGDAYDAETDIDRLIDILTLGNTSKIRGPLSDKDLQILKNAGTVLSKKRISEDRALEELKKIAKVAEKYTLADLVDKYADQE